MLGANTDGNKSNSEYTVGRSSKGQEYNVALDNIKQLLLMTQDMAQAHFDVSREGLPLRA